ncbi:hypothetical protein, partial [Helicobacter typhlonius]|uniref:hypothetical protein n=1 Tax=Helicobacter typhlonius TaxID=76936 RepID=UPI002FE09405
MFPRPSNSMPHQQQAVPSVSVIPSNQSIIHDLQNQYIHYTNIQGMQQNPSSLANAANVISDQQYRSPFQQFQQPSIQ